MLDADFGDEQEAVTLHGIDLHRSEEKPDPSSFEGIVTEKT